MLLRLHIENYAIIDSLRVEFSGHLNCITGETGAGKSILVGALSLVLGERADTSVLQQKDKKAVIEAVFHIRSSEKLKLFLKENDLDIEEELLVRREISANGKSRAFINDTPVNLQQLRTAGGFLVDLHQQFDTMELTTGSFQQSVLDALAGNGPLLKQYMAVYSEFNRLKKELDELKTLQASANAAADYNQFLYDELDKASFTTDELEAADAEMKLLTNSEEVKLQLTVVHFDLQESDQPIVQQLKTLTNKLQALQDYHPGIAALVLRMQSAQVELQDIASDLEHINDSVQYDAKRIAFLNERMALGYGLQKKHAVNSTAGLLAIQEELRKKLDAVFNISELLQQKEVAAEQLLQQCRELATRLSASRKKAAIPFAEKVNALLSKVGMPNARFLVSLQAVPDLKADGGDILSFLFNANLPAGSAVREELFEPLAKVASGGELSRLMLCISSLVAEKLQLPTLIFDEIDSGISGEAAKQVGNIMKGLSAKHQLIAITHQPQIAAKADAHYFVYKAINKDKIVTSIKLLDNAERITVIAQMLSGEKPTAAALQNAREMVGN